MSGKDKSDTKVSALRLLIIAPSRSDETATESPVTLVSKPLPEASPFAPFLTALTKTAPSEGLDSYSGYTSHTPLTVSTRYFTASVTLWCDEIDYPDTASSTSSEWLEQMLSTEAAEVRNVIGGVVVLLPFTQSRVQTDGSRNETLKQWQSLLESINRLSEAIEDETGRDHAKIAVVQDMAALPASSDPATTAATTKSTHSSLVPELEDKLLSGAGIFGWDIVSWQAPCSIISTGEEDPVRSTSKNEFGEKTGIPRVLEVISQIDWTAVPDLDLDVDADNDDIDPTRHGYSLASVDDVLAEIDDDNDFMPGSRPNISAQPFGRNADPVAQQSHEFQREIMDLHFALDEPDDIAGAGRSVPADEEKRADESFQVDQLAGMMDRVVAIREAGSEMSRAEREKFAKREIAKIMREMT